MSSVPPSFRQTRGSRSPGSGKKRDYMSSPIRFAQGGIASYRTAAMKSNKSGKARGANGRASRVRTPVLQVESPQKVEKLRDKRKKMKRLIAAPELGRRERPLPWNIAGSYSVINLKKYMPSDAGKPVKIREPRDRSKNDGEFRPIPVPQVLQVPQVLHVSDNAVLPAMGDAPVTKKQIGFFDLPREVRNMVYRHLLVQPDQKNIVVHSGWTKVFERRLQRSSNLSERPDFPIRGLHALLGRNFMKEALPVLYGDNTFEYFFRDAAETFETDGTTAGSVSESANDSDCPFEDTKGHRPKHSRKSKEKKENMINIEKYGHLVRNLALRIESNRTGPEYREIMAQAVNVFNNLRGRKANIHTITIHISPTWTDDETVSYTDYFMEDSAITEALKKLACQFIKIVIHTPRHREVTVIIDRRYAASIRRAERGKEEFQLSSEVSNIRREVEATKEWKKMNSIAQMIRNECISEAGPAKSATPAVDGDGDTMMTNTSGWIDPNFAFLDIPVISIS